jgi:copper/silver efflux system protein
MIDRIIAFSIRNRALVIAIALVLGVAGAFAASRTPMDAIPDLSENQVIVFTDWLGHSPREIEDQISYPLSVNLQGLRGVRVVRSSSDFNFSMISVIFEDQVPIADARRSVAERLAQSSGLVPSGARPALAPDAPATGQIYWYTVEGAGYDLGRLRSIQDWYVKPQLSSVPGVAEVASVGGYPLEYQISIDPIRLQQRDVSLREIVEAVSQSNSSVGGHAIQKGNAEYIVRGVGWLGASASGDQVDSGRIVRDLERVVIARRELPPLLLGDVAKVAIGPGTRRGVLEKDGDEVAGGVILIAYGENPLQVTERVKAKIQELLAGLPTGVRIVPFYDRSPLIQGAIRTVSGTLIEAMVTASICVVLVLLHLRTSFIITITLPLAALGSFLLMWLLRTLGLVDIQTNIMSLAGLAISIGVLVDSSVVMAENVMHRLKEHFGDQPVRGDVRDIVLPACQAVGRPIFFSIMIMLLSFLPVFALGGMEGKMFHPLAFTKSFALLTVSGLAITLVPALCTVFIRGRLRNETDSWLVRGVIDVYRPVLSFFLDHPAAIFWVVGATFLVGFAPIGSRGLLQGTLLVALVAYGWTCRRNFVRIVGMLGLIVIALAADRWIPPLDRQFLTPLDEGMVMDMPITIPRASVTESADDLKARDMILCRFPEVDMVVGKAGRAETPTDPAPMDMIETMVNFRPRDLWPRRKLKREDAEQLALAAARVLAAEKIIRAPAPNVVAASLDEALPLFDAASREYAYQRFREFGRQPALAVSGHHATLSAEANRLWTQHARALDLELLDRAAPTFFRLIVESLLDHAEVVDPLIRQRALARRQAQAKSLTARPRASHHGSPASVPTILLEPFPRIDTIREALSTRHGNRFSLWRTTPEDLYAFGGEMDRAVSMPGWVNVWTMPIQNRVDMLSTGVNTQLGVRVLGRRNEDVAEASETIAAALRGVPGAAEVVADPARGKGYLEVIVDREKAARRGVVVAELNDTLETAMGGKQVATTVEVRERHPVRVRYARDFRGDEDAVRRVLVPSHDETGRVRQIPLVEVADVRITEGPATIKSENGLLRNYVRLNVRGRNLDPFLDDARRVVARLKLPEGVYAEWTGQFEHERHARDTLRFVLPSVVALILLVLYWTYRDWADALLMLTAVPGSIAGGVLFQWLFGEKFSVTVWVGYIACFGMATCTGIIMLVYLRESIESAGGLSRMTLNDLKAAVMRGAVHRLRPKLLTEGTTIIGLAPMLWATGPGSEIIRPMVAPVMGGLLVADEVVDLLLPVLFYWVRRYRWNRIHRSRGDNSTISTEGPGVEVVDANGSMCVAEARPAGR